MRWWLCIMTRGCLLSKPVVAVHAASWRGRCGSRAGQRQHPTGRFNPLRQLSMQGEREFAFFLIRLPPGCCANSLVCGN
jgi:hypothetical protein